MVSTFLWKMLAKNGVTTGCAQIARADNATVSKFTLKRVKFCPIRVKVALQCAAGGAEVRWDDLLPFVICHQTNRIKRWINHGFLPSLGEAIAKSHSWTTARQTALSRWGWRRGGDVISDKLGFINFLRTNYEWKCGWYHKMAVQD